MSDRFNKNKGYEILEQQDNKKIVVLGIGGCGCNNISSLLSIPSYNEEVANTVHHFLLNTDFAAIKGNLEEIKEIEDRTHTIKNLEFIPLGKGDNAGHGAGANIYRGRDLAQESISEIEDAVKGASLVFITAGMGGGTGTLGASVIADAARDIVSAQGKERPLIISIVNTPFKHERREKAAKIGVRDLRVRSDATIIVSNENIYRTYKSCSMEEGHKEGSKVIANCISTIIRIIRNKANINADFEDLKTVLQNSSGEPSESTILSATLDSSILDTVDINDVESVVDLMYEKSMKNPLFLDIDISKAKAILVLLELTQEFTLEHINQFMDRIIPNKDDLDDDDYYGEFSMDEDEELDLGDDPVVITSHNYIKPVYEGEGENRHEVFPKGRYCQIHIVASGIVDPEKAARYRERKAQRDLLNARKDKAPAAPVATAVAGASATSVAPAAQPKAEAAPELPADISQALVALKAMGVDLDPKMAVAIGEAGLRALITSKVQALTAKPEATSAAPQVAQHATPAPLAQSVPPFVSKEETPAAGHAPASQAAPADEQALAAQKAAEEKAAQEKAQQEKAKQQEFDPLLDFGLDSVSIDE